VVFRDQVHQQRRFLFLLDRMQLVLHGFGSGVARRDTDLLRLVQQAGGQFANVLGEGGREQQVLATRRQQTENLADVADKAHVEHAIGFVEDEDFQVLELDRVLLVQVKQTARRGNKNV